ncbi:uncharacterized protein TNCV_2593111 [Trichonephila clavipes]|nr:uncharacterized protein TNCV_2593111 [Trichonephila clavipes]
MIKFIDFCEVWFSPRMSGNPGVGDHTVTFGIDLRDVGCVLGVQQTKQLPHVAKVDLRKIRIVSRPGKQFNLVIDEEPFNNACHVWSCIILLKYGCDQALKSHLKSLVYETAVATWEDVMAWIAIPLADITSTQEY